MKIKQVSKLTGLTEKTIRYYESKSLVKPDMSYLNGRYFRDYSREQILTLQTVATLRRAKFTVDQIAVMQLFPEQISEILSKYIVNLRKERDNLDKLIEMFENNDMGKAASIFELASRLEAVTNGMRLPAIDLKFKFKRFDKISAEVKGHINSRPLLNFRFGWFSLYAGHDFQHYQDIKSSLTAAGLKFRAGEYTATARLSIQGLINQGSGSQIQRGPNVTSYGLQAKALSDKAMDMYYVEVRRKDAEKAKEALRLSI